MPFDVKMTITGIQAAQNANIKRIAAFQPRGALGRAMKHAIIGAHRYLVDITHVDTGTYQASQRMDLKGDHGRIYVDPSAVNPRSGQRPAEYAQDEEARGGSHAAYARTVKEAGPRLVKEAIEIMERGVMYAR